MAQPDAKARAPQGCSSQVVDEVEVGTTDAEGDHDVVAAEPRPEVRDRAHEVPEPLWVLPRCSTRSVPLHVVPATSRVGPRGDPVREVARIRRPVWHWARGHRPPRARVRTSGGGRGLWTRESSAQIPHGVGDRHPSCMTGAQIWCLSRHTRPISGALSRPRHAGAAPRATASEPLTCANALPPPGFSEPLASHVTTGQDSHNI